MATGTYRGVTVQVSDAVAQGLPSVFNMHAVAGPVASADRRDAAPQTVAPAQTVHEATAPAKTASRGEWAKYAESVGIEPGDMTRAELIAATSR